VKYIEAPKNVHTQVFEDEEAAIAGAQEELQRFEGDAAIVTKLDGMSQRVIHRLEWAEADTARAKAGGQ
jgi:hypothetical protein